MCEDVVRQRDGGVCVREEREKMRLSMILLSHRVVVLKRRRKGELLDRTGRR